MRRGGKMLSWNVYVYDFNAKEIRTYDIFAGGTFLEEFKKEKKKVGDDKEAFLKRLDSLLMYHFWARCEWEIILSAWPPSNDRKEEKKVDVYSQIKLNWKQFGDYVWENI